MGKTLACIGLTIVALLAAPGALLAQSGSGIAGSVKDPTGAVLPGVTVEASSPALIEKTRSVVTDAEGQYKIVDLRPGEYSVMFSLSGFTPLKRDGIGLTSGFTATVNAELTVGNVSETIIVTSATPTVDVQNIRQQRVVTREIIDALPTARNFQGLAVMTPGVIAGGGGMRGSSQDVGGLAGEAGRLYVHGSREADQVLLMDGLPHYNLAGSQTGTVRFDSGEAAEFNYQIGANSAEQLSGGIVIDLIPRDGGNRISGSSFANVTGSRLQSDNLTQDLRSRGLEATDRVKNMWDVSTTLGGPIKQNKIWYFGSFRYWGTNNYIGGVFANASPNPFLYTPDLSRQALDDSWYLNTSLRVTVQPTPKNRVTVYAARQPRRSLPSGATSTTIRMPDALNFQSFPRNWYGQAKWTAPLTSRVLAEAGLSLHRHTIFNVLPSGVAEDSWAIVDARTNFAYGAPAPWGPGNVNDFDSYRGALSYVTGSHAAKVGLTFSRGQQSNGGFVNHDISLTLLNGVPNRVTLHARPFTAVSDLDAMVGLFAQDQWTIKRLTLNAGLRFDYHKASNPAQSAPAVRFVGPRDFAPIHDVPNWKDLSPRVGVAYDLFGNAKTALKGTLSHYVVNEIITLANQNNPFNTSSNTANRTWNDLNGDFIPQCDFLAPEANAECGPLGDLNFGKPRITTTFDPNVIHGFSKRPDNWEVTGVVQQELLPWLSMNAGYFRRWYGHFQVTDNLEVTPQDFDSFCITAPRDSRLPGGGGQQICDLYDVNLTKFGRVQNFVTSADTFGKRTEIYDGVDVIFNARLPRGAMLYGGFNTGRTKMNSCLVVDSPQLRFCDVRPPFQTNVKVSGSYTLPWDVQVSGTFQALPGPEITAAYVATNADIVPGSLNRRLSAGTATVPLVEPGTLFAERLTQVDLRGSKDFRVGGVRVRGMVDAYNVFNANPVLGLNNQYSAQAWQRPTFVLPGRLVKFGVQIDY